MSETRRLTKAQKAFLQRMKATGKTAVWPRSDTQVAGNLQRRGLIDVSWFPSSVATLTDSGRKEVGPRDSD